MSVMERSKFEKEGGCVIRRRIGERCGESYRVGKRMIKSGESCRAMEGRMWLWWEVGGCIWWCLGGDRVDVVYRSGGDVVIVRSGVMLMVSGIIMREVINLKVNGIILRMDVIVFRVDGIILRVDGIILRVDGIILRQGSIYLGRDSIILRVDSIILRRGGIYLGRDSIILFGINYSIVRGR